MQDRSSQILMHHYRNPVGNFQLDNPTGEAICRNNLCGDEIQLQVRIDEQGRFTELGWQAKGCMLVKSSASILSKVLNKQSVDEARSLAESIITWLDSYLKEPEPAGLSGDLVAFEQMYDYPARIPCIRLVWQAFMDATSGS